MGKVVLTIVALILASAFLAPGAAAYIARAFPDPIPVVRDPSTGEDEGAGIVTPGPSPAGRSGSSPSMTPDVPSTSNAATPRTPEEAGEIDDDPVETSSVASVPEDDSDLSTDADEAGGEEVDGGVGEEVDSGDGSGDE